MDKDQPSVSSAPASPAIQAGKMTVPCLDPARLSLRLDECGMLEGTVEGAQVVELQARAAFPFSLPTEFIELRSRDDKLVGFIRKLELLDSISRAAVEKAVRLHHFVPRILRVQSIKGKHGLYIWRVLTDRGAGEFTTRGRRQNIEEVTGDEQIVTDIDGNRFRIPKIPDLDARSLMHLRRVL